ncbi:MAG: PIN domain-containing protein [Gemmatimonadetes bacterium]|nr:PIN domain-containing protein [Gemmatimonadota bacterium]
MTRVVIDTGPIVALLNRRDRHHAWVREVLDTVEPPVFTCEAVVSEACFLLGRLSNGQDAVLELLASDVVKLDFRMLAEIDALRGLMRAFANVPMSLADACLVRMTELEPRSVIVTLDSDFRVYRRNRRQVVPTIMPGRDSVDQDTSGGPRKASPRSNWRR